MIRPFGPTILPVCTRMRVSLLPRCPWPLFAGVTAQSGLAIESQAAHPPLRARGCAPHCCLKGCRPCHEDFAAAASSSADPVVYSQQQPILHAGVLGLQGLAQPGTLLQAMPQLAVVDAARYQVQLDAKAERIRQLFADFNLPQLELHSSPTEHYRLRAEFSVWHEGPEVFYVMYDKVPDGRPSAEKHAEANLAHSGTDDSTEAAAAEESLATEALTTAPNGNVAAATVAAQETKPPLQQAAKKSRRSTAKKRRRAEQQASRPQLRRVRVESFPVGSVLMNELMAGVMAEVRQQEVLRSKLFQVNFHTTLSGDAMISLLYHRKLEDSWREAADKLRSTLAERCPAFKGTLPGIMGRSRGVKAVLGEEHVTEQLTVADGRTFTYRQIEGGFAQPNGIMCQHMLSWAIQATQGRGKGLLELYCGNGNFTVALASNFDKVVATELAKVSVMAAEHNMAANGITNVHVARLSSEEFVQAWRGERIFARMQGVDVQKMELQTLLVDPPRAGLDDVTVQLLKHFDTILYISCNPATLHDNMQHIKDSHSVQRFALFDQFPYTDHTECGVLMQRQ